MADRTMFDTVHSQPPLDRLVTALSSALPGHGRLSLPAYPGGARALTAWGLQRARGQTVLVVTDGATSLEAMHRDLTTLTPSPEAAAALLYYPPWEAVPGQDTVPDAEICGLRLQVCLALLAPGPHIVATCVQALMQRALSPAALAHHTLSLTLGDEHELDDLVQTLTEAGYEPVPEVEAKGQSALRGGLLDVWPTTEDWPVRIEFMGSAVESIRTFDPAGQRSRAKLDTVCIPPSREWALLNGSAEEPNTLLTFLPKTLTVLWSDTEAIHEHAAVFEDLSDQTQTSAFRVGFDDVQRDIDRREHALQVCIGLEDAPDAPRLCLDLRPVRDGLGIPPTLLQPDLLEQARDEWVRQLSARAERGQDVMLFLDTEGSLEHFRSGLPEGASERIRTAVGRLSGGFISDTLDLAIVGEGDLYARQKLSAGRYDPRGSRKRPAAMGSRIADLTDIQPGDYVVHIEHGIGRYEGLNEIVFSGQNQEVLTIEYADDAKLHVPVSHIHFLSRYVGMSRRQVQLHRLGGRRWTRDKAAAEEAIVDLAADLLETQAQRELLNGEACAADVPWQHEFEASFPYVETEDQRVAIEAVMHDQESPRPMDRLVCGDAGYGKTEVAMRAAFRTVMAGRQVAVLVPTTVLAQQHFDTFVERMSPYPVRIEMLSRFRSRGERTHVAKGLADGSVDVVIGTHALIQPDITFNNLGLVIVDEEQRFGVVHKERFKHMRRLVDVLTLTATPIPRTLYMSMTGARDMSLIQTPPGERMAIETLVTRSSDKVIREAILREVNREGQVFYLHNRVMSIYSVKDRLDKLVPEARCVVAHGQMAAGELADVMHAFVAGEFDVLLCTTIIESGVDIPRANTILIDRADRFGIADLYQLRGRVGRSSHKAYAYLLLPPHGRIDSDARERIGAVKRFSNLSAGFNLALRDLEIRGAGNLLGTAQSGHVTAIGFGLYCQLLKQSVNRLKGEPTPPVVDVEMKLDFIDLTPDPAASGKSAAIPYSYIEEEGLRISTYRKIAEIGTEKDVAAVRDALADRFGPPPASVARLLTLSRIRVACAQLDITRVETKEGKLMLSRGDDYLMVGSRFPRLKGKTPEGDLREILRCVKTSDDWSLGR